MWSHNGFYFWSDNILCTKLAICISWFILKVKKKKNAFIYKGYLYSFPIKMCFWFTDETKYICFQPELLSSLFTFYTAGEFCWKGLQCCQTIGGIHSPWLCNYRNLKLIKLMMAVNIKTIIYMVVAGVYTSPPFFV